MNTSECSSYEIVGPQFRGVLVYVIRWKRDCGSHLRHLEVRSYDSMAEAIYDLDPFSIGASIEKVSKYTEALLR